MHSNYQMCRGDDQVHGRLPQGSRLPEPHRPTPNKCAPFLVFWVAVAISSSIKLGRAAAQDRAGSSAREAPRLVSPMNLEVVPLL